ncbi:MAG: hypothetical protein AAF721_05660 [Myxococcota bacterium]
MVDRLIVEVVDEAGALLRGTSAELGGVALSTIGGRTMARLPEHTTGTQALELAVPGHPKLLFAVEVTDRKAGRTLKFVGGAPRCCMLTQQHASAGDASSPLLTVLRFALRERHSEVVMLTGYDYDDGNRIYLEHAEFWRDDLYAGKTGLTGSWRKMDRVIFDHTVVTIFDCHTGDRIRQMKTRRGWHEMDRVLQGSVRTVIAKGKKANAEKMAERQAADSLSVVHVYRYIEELGRVAPGSVHRFDYFGHAHTGGPILVNTNQRAEFAKGARLDERDPLDKDGRFKDFTAKNMNVAHFKAAFAAGAGAQVWGCNYNQPLRGGVQKSYRKRDPDAIVLRGKKGREFTKAEFEAILDPMLLEMYAAGLAKRTGLDVRAMPPGLGTRFGGVRNRYQRLTISAPTEYKYWKKFFGLKREAGGFVVFPPSGLHRKTP